MIARLLHGFTDRLPPLRCCGKRWNDLPRHLRFAHGEEVVIPERETVPCFCGAPAVGWIYDVMSDGQCIDGEARCPGHMEPQL